MHAGNQTLFAAAFLLLAASGSARAAESLIVVIDNFSFKPNVVTVKPGTHVVFKNQDDLPHTVVIPGMQVKSSMLDTDASYEADFEKPGDFSYFCGIHPMMTGEVVVKDE
jgi:plastocyanin